jgi:hypothetical protein
MLSLILYIIFGTLVFLFFFILAFFTWQWSIARKMPPSYGVIEQAYYVCRKCKLLEGGIFGKGPIRKFHSNREWCWRSDWERISKQEFIELAQRWYQEDLRKESDFWAREE